MSSAHCGLNSALRVVVKSETNETVYVGVEAFDEIFGATEQSDYVFSEYFDATMSSLKRLAEIAREYEDENCAKNEDLVESQDEQNRTDSGSVLPFVLLGTASIMEMGIAFQLFTDADSAQLMFACTFGQMNEAVVRQVWIPTNATMLSTFVTQLSARNGSEYRSATLPHFDETNYRDESRRVMTIEHQSLVLHFGMYRTIPVAMTGKDLRSLTEFLSELAAARDELGKRQWASDDRRLVVKCVREDFEYEWVLLFIALRDEVPAVVTLNASFEDLDHMRACATEEQVQIWGRAQVECPVVVTDN